MSDKETSEVCDMCKKTVAIVVTNKLYWCANCYTNYLTRMMLAHPRRKGASH
jgi:protein-arginine kinase activator protein McsA